MSVRVAHGGGSVEPSDEPRRVSAAPLREDGVMSNPPARPPRNPRLLDEATLTVMIAAGEIDTVIVAF